MRVLAKSTERYMTILHPFEGKYMLRLPASFASRLIVLYPGSVFFIPEGIYRSVYGLEVAVYPRNALGREQGECREYVLVLSHPPLEAFNENT